jgi:molybdenum cofactor cytidylyltransferase
VALTGAGIGIVLLAAGGSSRMGSPKQLLRIRGRAMVRRAAETALATGCDPIVVVLGCEANQVREELEGLPLWITENSAWSDGIGSSIRTGVQILEQTEVDAALLLVCDQPLITSDDLEKLIAVSRANPGSIVASYDEVVGAPALFPRQWFTYLLQLRGDQSARHLLLSNAAVVRRVSLDSTKVDIDTRDTWTWFVGKKNI